jgi:hypothetical protein
MIELSNTVRFSNQKKSKFEFPFTEISYSVEVEIHKRIPMSIPVFGKVGNRVRQSNKMSTNTNVDKRKK